MELEKRQKIGIIVLIIGIAQFLFIWFGLISPTVFNIDDEDNSNVLDPGESKQLIIDHSFLLTNRFIVAVGQGFTEVAQPAEVGDLSLENQDTGEIWNFSYTISSISAYFTFIWEEVIWDLPAGKYILRDTNGNSDDLDYRIINAGFFRSLDPEYVTGDAIDSTETGIFYFSMIGGIVLGLVGLRLVFSRGKIPDYRKTDHTKGKYKLPKLKRKKPKKSKKVQKLAEKEAVVDDFEKRIKPQKSEPDKEKWEWE